MKGVWSLSLGAAASSGPALQALYSSHGNPIILKPSVYDYTVLLNAPTSAIALIPKIDESSMSSHPLTTTTTTTTTTPPPGSDSSNTTAMSFWGNLAQAGQEQWKNWNAQHEQTLIEPICNTRVRMTWNGMPVDHDSWVQPEASALAMMKQIPLPENGEDLIVKIDLEKINDDAKNQKQRYTVRFKQQLPAPTGLMGIEASDEMGERCIISPTLAEDVQRYFVYANPKAKRVNLNVKCRGGSSTTMINGKKHKSKDANGFHSVMIDRDLDHHTQLVQVVCASVSKYTPSGSELMSGQIEKRYAIHIISDYLPSELDTMPTKLYIPSIDKYCAFDQHKLQYRCPDPQLAFHLVQLRAENEPTVKYTLFNKRRSVELRLLNKQLSIPFTYSSSFTMRHEAGRYYKDYPLTFDGGVIRSILGGFGTLLGGLLFAVTGALLVIIGASSVFTLGFPIGATEIAGTLAFIIQYLCFSQTLKGSPSLTEFTDPLKWFTLFAPAPIKLVNDDCTAPWKSAAEPAGRVGDLHDFRNAEGAMVWGLLLLAAFLLTHSGVLFRFKVLERNYTMPHHIRFGGWENRVLHFLLFPMIVGATYVLTLCKAGVICPVYKGLAALIVIGFLAWILYETIYIHRIVRDQKVVWVWNASVREDGLLEDESGYWTDATADQLLTQPVNRARSLLRRIFPFTWVSPVADIVPQPVCNTPVSTDPLNPPQKYRTQTHNEASYALSKTPQCVEIIRCRKPGGICRGQRLIAGLLRTSWLDVLFTYESLTQFHSNVTGKCYTSVRRTPDGRLTSTSEDVESPRSSNFLIPAIVKTSQLSGPITGGTSMFFFDGTRVPFIRIAECLYRLIVGACLGVVLGNWAMGRPISSACFGIIAAVSLVLLMYTSVVKPYTRAIEGWLSVATLGTVATSALAFMVYYIFTNDQLKERTLIADISLWLIIGCCFALAAYSVVIDTSILAAVLCPPLDETKFLESLANVSVAITNPLSGGRVETPGFSKYVVQEILMQATQTGRAANSNRVHVSVTPSKQEPCLEFSEKQIRQACQANGVLPLPVATVIARSTRERVGYKWLHIQRPSEEMNRVADFLTQDEEQDAFPGVVAREIARHIKYQTETRGRNGQTLLTVNIAPPSQN